MKKIILFTLLFTATIFYGLAITVTLTPTPAGCGTTCDGTVTSTVSGGVAPYTYLWNNGQTTSSISNLCPGYYNVMVTDFVGSVAYASTYVAEDVTSGASFPWLMTNTTGDQRVCDMVHTFNNIYAIGWANGNFTINGNTYNFGPGNIPDWNLHKWIFVVKMDHCGNIIEGHVYGSAFNSEVRLQIEKIEQDKIVVSGNYDGNMSFMSNGTPLPNTGTSEVFLAFLDCNTLFCSNITDQLSFSSDKNGPAFDLALGLSSTGISSVICGDFMGTDINFYNPVTSSYTTLVNTSNAADMFIARYDWNTTLHMPELKWVYNNYNGTPNTLNDWGFHTKYVNGNIYFTTVTANSTYGIVSFIWRVNATTGALLAVSRLGSAYQYFAVNDMASYGNGLYLCGYYQSVYNQAPTSNKQAYAYYYPNPATSITWTTANLKLSPQANPSNISSKMAMNSNNGDLYVSGYFASSSFYLDVANQTSLVTGTIANQYVAKFNSALVSLDINSIYSGTSGSYSAANAVVYDDSHSMFYVGGFMSGTINLENGSQQMVSSAASDAFIARFDMSMTYKNLHAQNPESGIQTDWNEFNLWPNPSNGLLEISTEKDNVIDEVMIYDATGRSVYSGKSAQNNVVVNLPELPTGPYYVSILTNGKTLHKKLIIVK